VADRIRAAALQPTAPDQPLPLPLASHWNTGFRPDGFDPRFQLAELRRGRYLLPWFQLPRPDGDLPDDYFEPVLEEWKHLRLPMGFISTQWDVLVAEAAAGVQPWSQTPPLSPASSPELWYAAGRRWGDCRRLRHLQERYPNPPLVLFVSNNEQPRLSWQQVRERGLRLPGWSPGDSDDDLRRAVGDAWIERYGALLRGFREALASKHWQAAARFIGYEAFGQCALGRWPGWGDYSLHADGRLEPWSSVWDGASVSYYTSDWNPSSDFRVYSPQVESMNWVPMLQEARRRRPDFWFELSVWDGRSDNLAEDKDDFYRRLGQAWTAERYAGMVKFGMWLLRPRVVREFRDPQSPRSRYGSYFDVVLEAVGQVHDEPTLGRFWREGRLVPNARDDHPYRAAVSPELQQLSRWFLLDADANPPQPWNLETALEVYALALESGRAPQREWLVYAHSPLAASRTTRVTITSGIRPELTATRGGRYALVREVDGAVRGVAC
jgi:hypothetical protein